jgi:hypothetical protein
MVCLEEQAQDAGLQTSAAADSCNLLPFFFSSLNLQVDDDKALGCF